MDSPAVIAARNNAEWCDLVCRTHGVETKFDHEVWVALRRSPPLYPDAVTLREHVTAGEVLRRVDSTPGCSIKDSFAAIDLSRDGFAVLFEAQWIHRPPAVQVKDGPAWTQVRTPEELRAFSGAHGAGDTFLPALLDNPDVAILMAREGAAVVAGLIGNRSGSIVGMSNLFTASADVDLAWASAAGAVSARFPGLPLVGYEEGASLRAARRAGFTTVGPLRVWLKD